MKCVWLADVHWHTDTDRRANARQAAQETAARRVRGDADPYEHLHIYIYIYIYSCN